MKFPDGIFALQVTIIVLWAGSVHSQNQVMTPVSNICLKCLCTLLTNCNGTFGCEGRFCGLFRISQDYWVDAFKPTQPGDYSYEEHAYVNCVTERLCAARTVRSYMSKYKRDCNNDGRTDCYDYAAIHIHGSIGCALGLNQEQRNVLNQCLESFTT